MEHNAIHWLFKNYFPLINFPLSSFITIILPLKPIYGQMALCSISSSFDSLTMISSMTSINLQIMFHEFRHIHSYF